MGHDPQLREVESSRLDSWKEIASFLHRDARTVRRWERERKLPVHRVPGGERSGVFAYVSELESWLHTAGPIPNSSSGPIAAIVEDASAGTTSKIAAEHTENDGVQAEPAHAENTTQDSQHPPPLFAFHSLNTLDTVFGTDLTAPTGKPIPKLRRSLIEARALSRIRSYQAISLLVLLSLGIGISAGVIHYRNVKLVKVVVHTPKPEAQDLYLRGRYYWNLRTEDGLNCAVDLFTQSIVNDPNYAEAYAGLADAYLLLRQYGHMSDAEAYPRALAAARQAIALNDSSPEAHRSIAFVLRFWNWDMAAAEKEYRRAIELNPNDSQSHHWYATALFSSGRYREALTQIDIARRLEPQSVSVLADRGLILSTMDLQAGLTALQQAAQAQPGFVSTHVYLSHDYLQREDYQEFLAESRLVAELSHNATMTAVLKTAAKTLAARGPKPMLREMALSVAPLADRGMLSAYTAARLFGLAGEPADAMRYLRLACDRRDSGFLNASDDLAFKVLHSSPEYMALISKRDAAPGTTKQPIARLDAPPLSR